MGLFRTERDVTTGESIRIDQIAYKNADGEILVLDAMDDEPEGYTAFDPEKEDAD